MQGWIKVPRQLRLDPIFNDFQMFRLLMICFFEATHKSRKQIVGRQSVSLEPGQWVTGRYRLHSLYNHGLEMKQQISASTIWRWLETLESLGFLDIISSSKFSVITVLNWDKHQFDGHQNEQKMNTNKNTFKTTSRPKSNKTIYDQNSVPYILAALLYERIQEFKPDLKKPDLHKWADDTRKLIELDKRNPEQIANVIDWATKDPFWQSNVLSAAAVRKQWDTLTAKMAQKNNRATEKKAVPIDFRASNEERDHVAKIYANQ